MHVAHFICVLVAFVCCKLLTETVQVVLYLDKSSSMDVKSSIVGYK